MENSGGTIARQSAENALGGDFSVNFISILRFFRKKTNLSDEPIAVSIMRVK
jgi:hypothetical protein